MNIDPLLTEFLKDRNISQETVSRIRKRIDAAMLDKIQNQPLNLNMSPNTLVANEAVQFIERHPMFTAGMSKAEVDADLAMVSEILQWTSSHPYLASGVSIPASIVAGVLLRSRAENSSIDEDRFNELLGLTTLLSISGFAAVLYGSGFFSNFAIPYEFRPFLILFGSLSLVGITKWMADSDQAMLQTPQQTTNDKAALAENGGIDLNARNLRVDIAKEGSGIDMKFNPAVSAAFRRRWVIKSGNRRFGAVEWV